MTNSWCSGSHKSFSRLSLFAHQTVRIDHRDFRVAFEVAVVEGEQISDAVHEHRSNKVSVVSLFASNLVASDFFPILNKLEAFRAAAKALISGCSPAIQSLQR